MLKTVGNPSVRYGDQTIVDGNLVIGTAGKGIDFSIDPSAPGMTSELLDDYEEGTWTPVDASGAGLTITVNGTSKYTKIGRLCTCSFDITYPSTADASLAQISLPFTAASDSPGACGYNTVAAGLVFSASNGVASGVFTLGSAFQTNADLSAKRMVASVTFVCT